MSSYVGFANLPNQVHRKTVKRGFEFTLMVVGKGLHIIIYSFSKRNRDSFITYLA